MAARAGDEKNEVGGGREQRSERERDREREMG